MLQEDPIDSFVKIIFLNPRAAKVFQDMAYDAAANWPPSLILAESSGVVRFDSNENLTVKDVPRLARYNRTNVLTRVGSMAAYFMYVLVKVFFNSPRSLLFLVTTPPFLGLVGWLFKKLRRQRYVILVYDILPDAFVGAGLMKNGLIAKIWRGLNRKVLNNADAVITIGEYMAANLEKNFDASKTRLGHIGVVHNWADVESIKPLPKEQNPFLKEYDLQDKFIVMYSGNIGATHDMETLIQAACKLKDHPYIRFVVIGEGAQKQFVVDAKEKYGLDNMLVMSYLPQDQLPYSLPAADISIVTIAGGVEGHLVPCKFYACLAAGSALVAICNPGCEIADIVRNENCGKVVALGDAETLVETIVHYYQDKQALAKAQANSRTAAVQKYSRKNTQQYINVIEKVMSSRPTCPP